MSKCTEKEFLSLDRCALLNLCVLLCTSCLMYAHKKQNRGFRSKLNICAKFQEFNWHTYGYSCWRAASCMHTKNKTKDFSRPWTFVRNLTIYFIRSHIFYCIISYILLENLLLCTSRLLYGHQKQNGGFCSVHEQLCRILRFSLANLCLLLCTSRLLYAHQKQNGGFCSIHEHLCQISRFSFSNLCVLLWTRRLLYAHKKQNRRFLSTHEHLCQISWKLENFWNYYRQTVRKK